MQTQAFGIIFGAIVIAKNKGMKRPPHQGAFSKLNLHVQPNGPVSLDLLAAIATEHHAEWKQTRVPLPRDFNVLKQCIDCT